MTTPAAITLPSLLETHDQPFVIIDSSLRVVAVNRAYEQRFAADRASLTGSPCCLAGRDGRCRHHRLFEELEPYRMVQQIADTAGRELTCWVSGYPLVDADHRIYLGETLVPTQGTTTPRLPAMAGESPAFQRLKGQLDQAAACDVPVILIGETGTGKELAADYIHRHSRRAGHELVVVDCTVISEELFESELFGHEKGAFTGSTSSRDGLFQMGDQGTLFFDELGELPLSQQPKLLRALESGTWRRVGGTQIRRADVRVIAATHQPLASLVAQGQFRGDLYYRLAVFPIEVPPLRERRQDIPLLARVLLDQVGACLGRPYELSGSALARLATHSFPGNIRELRNILQLAAMLCATGPVIAAEHIVLPPGSPQPAEHSSLERLEAGYLADLLNRHRGNRKTVAAEMNISERTLYRKLKRFNLTHCELP